MSPVQRRALPAKSDEYAFYAQTTRTVTVTRVRYEYYGAEKAIQYDSNYYSDRRSGERRTPQIIDGPWRRGFARTSQSPPCRLRPEHRPAVGSPDLSGDGRTRPSAAESSVEPAT
jgi:hypothetical protein